MVYRSIITTQAVSYHLDTSILSHSIPLISDLSDPSFHVDSDLTDTSNSHDYLHLLISRRVPSYRIDYAHRLISCHVASSLIDVPYQSSPGSFQIDTSYRITPDRVLSILDDNSRRFRSIPPYLIRRLCSKLVHSTRAASCLIKCDTSYRIESRRVASERQSCSDRDKATQIRRQTRSL